MKNPSLILIKLYPYNLIGLGAIMGEGSALGRLGRYEEAIIYFDKILSMEPNHVYTLIEKGVALDFLGRYEEAIGYYSRVLAIELDNFGALKYWLGFG